MSSRPDSHPIQAAATARRRRHSHGAVVRGLFLIVLTFVFVYPFIWMILTSLKDDKEVFGKPWALPEQFLIQNYAVAWTKANLGRALLNSLAVSSLAVIIILVCSATAAYAFSRMRFKGNVLYMPILMCLSLPVEALIIPLFYELKLLNLTDRLLGLILVEAAVGIPFSLFILSEFFRGIPKSLEEAAWIDGASSWQIFFRVILPLSKAALSAVVVLQFLFIWNDFTLSLIIISKSEFYTIPLAVQVFTGKYFYDYPRLFAALAASSIPIILVYCLLQRQFIRGLTVGAVKG